jgi:hypothetical protein
MCARTVEDGIMFRIILISIALIFGVGCASIGSVPTSIEGVRFDDSINGNVGWSRYQGSELFSNINKNEALDAARFGLNKSGFVIKRDDPNTGYVIGEHGITMYDWNVICGVYVKETENGCYVKVIAQGSYDYGFAGDATGSDWPQDILRSMRQYLTSRKE